MLERRRRYKNSWNLKTQVSRFFFVAAATRYSFFFFRITFCLQADDVILLLPLLPRSCERVREWERESLKSDISRVTQETDWWSKLCRCSKNENSLTKNAKEARKSKRPASFSSGLKQQQRQQRRQRRQRRQRWWNASGARSGRTLPTAPPPWWLTAWRWSTYRYDCSIASIEPLALLFYYNESIHFFFIVEPGTLQCYASLWFNALWSL